MFDAKDMSYKSFRDYNSIISAEEEYNRQKRILQDYADRWRQKTLEYLNFSAKEQRDPGPMAIDKDANIYPNKWSWSSSYAQYLQRVRAENKIGLNKRNSFNRDKYGRKPPTHQYNLMGDVLRRPSQSAPVSAMSLERNSRANDQMAIMAQINETVGGFNQKRYTKWKERQNIQTLMPFVQSSADIYGGVRLSTNIKHKYGSKVCDEFLGDESAVVQTMADIDSRDLREKKSAPLFRPGLGFRRSQDVSRYPGQPKLSYHDISNTLRNDVFPGNGVIYNCGTTHADFNEDVCKIPVQFSEHRRKKLELNI